MKVMNCNWVKENATLLLYDELADDARHELEQHAALCKACAQELAELEVLHRALSTMPAEEPSANLLASSRMKLQEALEHTEQNRGFGRFTIDLAGWMRSVRFQPALATILLMVGFGGGIMATYATRPLGKGPEVQTPSNTIANISGITQDPTSNKVKIDYTTVQPATAEGSLTDPNVQRLL